MNYFFALLWAASAAALAGPLDWAALLGLAVLGGLLSVALNWARGRIRFSGSIERE